MNINHNLISENDNNIYYTLIFSPNLIKTKSRRKNKDKIVKGYKLTQQTNLPNDPRMLYGTNDNDVAKFTIIDRYMEWTFNFISKKESVKFWEETKVYTLPRDIRIIMWQGGEELNLSKDKYKIVTPEMFNYIKDNCCNNKFTESVTYDIIDIIKMETKSKKACVSDYQVNNTKDTLSYIKKVSTEIKAKD